MKPLAVGANIGGGWASNSSNDIAGAVTGVAGADLGSKYSALRISQTPLFLHYMGSRELEQFDKHLKLRCPWVLEPSLAGLIDTL